MTLDTTNFSPETTDHGTGNNTFTSETQRNIQSLLGLFSLDFEFHRDIENESIKDILGIGNYFIDNFEESGYSSIWKWNSWNGKQVQMGTGYAIVTEEYIKQRGVYQEIHLSQQGSAIGKTRFKNNKGEITTTHIYFVGPAERNNGKVIGITYSEKDIEYACADIEGMLKTEERRKIQVCS